MRKFLGGVAMISLTALFVTPVAAQDRCADVLRDGTIKLENYSENSYVRQILIRRFLNSNYESSKKDMSASATVPVGEIIMGGKYSNSDYNRKKRVLQSYFSSDMTEAREIDVAISSGDETIVGAWNDCMKKRNQPLVVRIEQQGAKRAELTIEYAGSGNGTTRLQRDVRLPAGVSIESGGEHFKRGARFIANTPRKIVLIMKDAITPVSVNVSTGAGDAVAYLPPRLRFFRLSRPLAIDNLRSKRKGRGGQDAIRTYTLYGIGSNPNNINLDAISFGSGPEADGWFFDTSIPFTPQLITRRSYYCKSMRYGIEPSSLFYRYRLESGDHRATTICEMSGVAQLVNEVWRAQDDNNGTESGEPLVAKSAITIPSINPADDEILASPIIKISYDSQT